MKIFYMRENHTFLPLPLNVEESVAAIREEFDNGHGHGSLCCKSVPNGFIDANGDVDKFEAQVRDFYAANVTEQNA